MRAALLALVASVLGRRTASQRRTWGFQPRGARRRGPGTVLTAVAVYVIIEGVRRQPGRQPQPRAAFLEVVNDAFGSVAVIVAALVIATTGWLRADALVSLLVGVLILPRAVMTLLDAALVLLESTPKGLDLAEVRRHLMETPHVREVHDLHASQIATGLPVLSAHIVVDASCFNDGHLPPLPDHLQRCVADHFPVSIEHSTFQFEQVEHSEREPSRHA